MLGVLESFQYVLALRHAKIHQSSGAWSSKTGQLLGKEKSECYQCALMHADDRIFFVNLFIRLNFVLLERCFFFQKAAHLSKLSLLFILAERHFMSWIFLSGFSCLSCIELSSVLAFCLYVTFLLNLPGNMTLSDFVLKSFYNLTIYYASMWKS